MHNREAKRLISRRYFLQLAGLAGGAATLAACAPQIVTQVVKETQIVKETQLVQETAIVKETQLITNVVTATPAPTAAAVTGELTIAWPNDAVNGPIYEAMWRQFQTEHPNIKMNLIWNGDQNKLIAAGTPSDFLHGGDVWPKELRLSLDLDPFFANDPTFDISQYFPNAVEPLKVDGKLKALPTFFNISLLYYNTALFDAAKLGYPTATWTKDDFLNAARALTLKAGGKVTQWGVEVSHGWWGTWLAFVRQAGGDWMDPKTGKVTLDSPEAVAGMQYFLSLLQPGPDKVSWLPTEDSLGGFQGGKVGMSYGSHTGNWNTYRQAQVPFDVEILPMGVKQQRGGEQAIDAWSIHKDTKSPAAAWEALKFISGFNAQFQYFSNAVGPTGRSDVAAELEKTPKASRKIPQNLESIYNAFDKGLGIGLPRHLGFVEGNQNHVQPDIDLILEGKLSVVDGLKQATTDAQDYLDATYPDGGTY